MKKYFSLLLFLLFSCATQTTQAPVPMHPDNPYVLLFPVEKDFNTTRQFLYSQFPESEWYYYYNLSTKTFILIKKKNTNQ